MVTHETRVRRLTLAGWILVLALLAYNCTRAAECHSGDIYVRGEGDEIVACVDGQYQPMLTLDESTEAVGNASDRGLMLGGIIGLVFGWALSGAGRRSRRV